jgi:hypothetical protein
MATRRGRYIDLLGCIISNRNSAAFKLNNHLLLEGACGRLFLSPSCARAFPKTAIKTPNKLSSNLLLFT